MFKQPVPRLFEQDNAPVYRLGKKSSLSLEGLGQDVTSTTTSPSLSLPSKQQPPPIVRVNDTYKTSSKKRRRPKNDEDDKDAEVKPPLKMAYDDDDDSVPQIVIHDTMANKRTKTGDSVLAEMMQRAQVVRISSLKTRVSKKGESKKSNKGKREENKGEGRER